jgi:hypothetical protein
MATPHDRLRDLGLTRRRCPGLRVPIARCGSMAGWPMSRGRSAEPRMASSPARSMTPPILTGLRRRPAPAPCALWPRLRMPWGSTISRAFCFLRGFVFAGPAFQGHTQVLDHVSRMLIAIFGDHGQHARSAVGHGRAAPRAACWKSRSWRLWMPLLVTLREQSVAACRLRSAS